jgi:hypothetical protein
MSNNPQNQDSLGEKLKAAFDSDNSDKNYNALKAVVSSVPAVGSLAVGFFDSYIVSPSMQRIRNFLENLVLELEELKSKIELVDFESPAFQTILIRAYQIAVRTHKEQKLEALRNIVLNSSIRRPLKDDILEMFLDCVDNFTELHISTLKHLHYLERYTPEQLNTYFPISEENEAVYNQVLKDLADKGLISLREDFITEEDKGDMYWRSLAQTIPQVPVDFHIRPGEVMHLKTIKRQENINILLANCLRNGSSTQESRTTKLGKQFIKFIEYPSIQTESM